METKYRSIQSPTEILHLPFSTVSFEKMMAGNYVGQEQEGEELKLCSRRKDHSRITRLALPSNRGSSPILTTSTSGLTPIRNLKVSLKPFTARSISSLERVGEEGSTRIFRCFPVPIFGAMICYSFENSF